MEISVVDLDNPKHTSRIDTQQQSLSTAQFSSRVRTSAPPSYFLQQAAFKSPWDGESGGGLLHLEHVNINIPKQGPARRLYYDILGFEPDVRRAQNLEKGSGTIWANMGTTQIHLPEGGSARLGFVFVGCARRGASIAARESARVEARSSGGGVGLRGSSNDRREPFLSSLIVTPTVTNLHATSRPTASLYQTALPCDAGPMGSRGASSRPRSDRTRLRLRGRRGSRVPPDGCHRGGCGCRRAGGDQVCVAESRTRRGKRGGERGGERRRRSHVPVR